MRFLIWVVVLFWGLALLRRAIAWMVRSLFGTPQHASPGGQGQKPELTHRLVRDPVCGLYIPEERAIVLRGGEQELRFCSIQCRDKYLGTRKYAANG